MFWLNFVILLNMKSVIKNISKLIQCDSNDIKFRAGNEMNSLETISNAFLEIAVSYTHLTLPTNREV